MVDGLDEEHRRLLAYAIVGLAETTSRHWLSNDLDVGAEVLAQQCADLAWAGSTRVARLTRTSALRSALVIAVVIVLAVAVLVLAAWLYGTRNALREARNRADELNERLDAANRDVERTMGELANAESNLADERKRADRRRRGRGRGRQGSREVRRGGAGRQRTRPGPRTRNDRRRGLWAVEAVRFDRMWRDHAAVGPDAPSPLADTADPARARRRDPRRGASRGLGNRDRRAVEGRRRRCTRAPAARLVRGMRGAARGRPGGRRRGHRGAPGRSRRVHRALPHRTAAVLPAHVIGRARRGRVQPADTEDESRSSCGSAIGRARARTAEPVCGSPKPGTPGDRSRGAAILVTLAGVEPDVDPVRGPTSPASPSDRGSRRGADRGQPTSAVHRVPGSREPEE